MKASSVSHPPLDTAALISSPLPPPLLLIHTLKSHIHHFLHILALAPRSIEDALWSLRKDALRLTNSIAFFCDNSHLRRRNSFKTQVLVTSLCYQPPSSASITSEFSYANNESTFSDSGIKSKEEFERGPAFFGHVYSMWDASESGLLGVRHVDSMKNQMTLPQFLPVVLSKLLKRAFPRIFGVKVQEPVFKFYIDKMDAEIYVKHVGLAGSIVGSFPLDTAYKVYKENPSMFAFIPSNNQVKMAKQVIRKLYGQKEAVNFQGVPVFTTHNLAVCLLTSGGLKWFRPYFFDKRELDILIGSSIDQYYRMLVRSRRKQRHSQGHDIDLLGELHEDDFEPFEPVEAQEFMEELGQSGIIFDSTLLKSLNASIQDLMDNIIFGNRWSRQVIGIQPRFPVHVESFLQRAAAAELQDCNKLAQTNIDASSFESEPSQMTSGRSIVSEASSSTSGGNTQFAATCNESNSNHEIESKEVHEKFQRKQESAELQLTIMGFASYGPASISETSTFMKDLSAAASDMESKISQVNRQNKELRPAFIADLRLQGEAKWSGMEGSSSR